MSVKNFFYKVGKILSEGKGRQLLWLTTLILFVLAVIILFSPHSWENKEDVLVLFFGADSLKETNGGLLGKLFIYILGTLLFSTFLISIITNIFDNFSDSYKEGQLDVHYTQFTLFLGSNYMLVGMLRALSEKKGLKKPIVILTTRNIGELREVLFSAFSSKQYRKFRNNLVLIYGERDNLESLDSVNAGGAEDIYILGEDNEENHDGKSLAAVRLLKGVSRAGNPRVNCKVFLNDPYSAHSQIVKSKEKRGGETGRFYLDLINIYDDIAERVLCERMPVVGPGSSQHLHLVVSGYGRMSWSFVKTAFALLHFPNFDETTLKNRTTISVIDKKAGQFMKEFLSLYANINILSNIRYEYMENGMRKVRCSQPGEEYGDFLDVEWEFIEGDLRDPDIRERLETWAGDNSQVLAVAICDMDEAVNIGTALSLPRRLYETSRVFAFLPSGSGILDTFGSDVFREKGSAIVPFGKESDTDILFEKRSEMAKRVNYVYCSFYEGSTEVRSIENEWYSLTEGNKLSNFYNASSIKIKRRSFGSDDLQLPSEKDRDTLDRVEHSRWTAAELLLGYYPQDIHTRDELMNLDEKTQKSRVKVYKEQYLHWDIAPYANLSSSEKEKDSALQLITYIVQGDISVLKERLHERIEALETLGKTKEADNLQGKLTQIKELYPDNLSK